MWAPRRHQLISQCRDVSNRRLERLARQVSLADANTTFGICAPRAILNRPASLLASSGPL
jgi:hypothetical protein